MSPNLKKTRTAATRKAPARPLSHAQVAKAVQTMSAPTGPQRFAAGKALAAAAQRDPDRVYPHLETIAALLKSNSKVVCWNALQTLAALARADQQRKLDALLPQILAFISAGKLITAANAVHCVAEIARARPDLLDQLIPPILAVQCAAYETPECRNVIIEHVLNVLRELWPTLRGRPDVAAFVRRQCVNTRANAARIAADLAGALPSD